MLLRGPRPRPPVPTYDPALTPITAFPWWLTTTDTLPTVTESSTLGLAAAWRALTLIGNSVAGRRLRAVVDDSVVTPTPSILVRPNAMYTPSEFWFAVVYSLLMRGNVYALKTDFDPAGYPRQLVLVHPDVVTVTTEAGRPWYHVGQAVFDWSQVWHVRWVTVPGQAVGLGVVESHRKGLGLAQASQDFSLNTFQNGSVPSGILKVDRPDLAEGQAVAVKAQWMAAMDDRAPAVLPRMYDFQPLSWSPEDAELLASRQMSVAEVALMFGLDPTDLGASIGGSSITYANIESREMARQNDTYGPIMTRLEESAFELLPGIMEARFDRPEHTDAATRADVHDRRLANGSLTMNEVRREQRRPEYGPWADQPFGRPPAEPPATEPAAEVPA